jgi:tRNA nucleotidyltransferase/poly(A) polymerase
MHRRFPSFPFIKELLAAFPKAQAFLVGGAVRDMMLGRKTKDFDFVVRGVPAKDLRRFLSKRGKVDLVGKRFGVFKFRPSSRVKGQGSSVAYDIALPRTEKAGMSGGYRDFEVQSDQALPIKKDLARRDFTVNAMAWDLKHGRLADPFGGMKDLKKHVIRAVGKPDERFREDHSRMLRAIRFAVVLNFKIERRTWKALVRDIRHLNDEIGGRRTVAYEVAAKEFMKAFAGDPVRTMDLWRQSGASAALLPELTSVQARFHRLTNQPHVFMGHHEAGVISALASVLAPLGAKAAAALVARFKFASVEGSRITPARVRRLIAGGKAAELKDRGVKPLLSANEVMRLLKLKPGPLVGKTLDMLLVAQAKGSIKTKGQARIFLSSKTKR